jgi:hypothetical protein
MVSSHIASPLLHLPAELRNEIDILAIPAVITPYACIHNSTYEPHCADCDTATYLPAPSLASSLLLTCRQIYQETLPLLYKYTTLNLTEKAARKTSSAQYYAMRFSKVSISFCADFERNTRELDVHTRQGFAAVFEAFMLRLHQAAATKPEEVKTKEVTLRAYEFFALVGLKGQFTILKPAKGLGEGDFANSWPSIPVKIRLVTWMLVRDKKKWESTSRAAILRQQYAEKGLALEILERTGSRKGKQEGGKGEIEHVRRRWCHCAWKGFADGVVKRFTESPETVSWSEMERVPRLADERIEVHKKTMRERGGSCVGF